MHEASLVEALLDEVANSVRQWSKSVELSGSEAATHAERMDPSGPPGRSDRAGGEPNESGLDRVTLVTIEIGPLSGVEAELVQTAFDRLACPRGLTRAALAIDQVPLTIRCQSCGMASDQLTATFRCRDCGGHRVTVERGDSVILKSIELLDE